LLNVTDNKGNTALHIASRKARHQVSCWVGNCSFR
jgi:hypothetical protein